MEMITRKAVGKFCASPLKITRDGTGTYLYKKPNTVLGSYRDGKRVQPTRKDTIYHAGHLLKIKF